MTKKPRPRRAPEVGQTLRTTAQTALNRARATLSDPTLGDPAVIHELRKALKRWRALLRLLAPAIGDDGRRLRRQARDLARSIGGSRDAQSALDALADLAASTSPKALPARTAASIRRHLEKVRTELERVQLSRAQRNRLVAALDAAADTAGGWPLDRSDTDEVAAALTRSYRRAHRRAPEAWHEASAGELHELRRRIAELRYQVEFVAPLLPDMPRRTVRDLQRLRSELGRHRDLTLLIDLAEPGQPLARWRSALLPLVAARQADHVAAAEKAAGRALSRSPKAFGKALEDYRG